MRAVFEIKNGLAAVRLDEASYNPAFGEAAALAKTYGHRMAMCSSLSEFEAFSLFKTIYASMVLEYATEKGLSMSPEMEEATQKKAMDFARNVTVRMLGDEPSFSDSFFRAPSTLLPEEGRNRSLFSDPEDLPF